MVHILVVGSHHSTVVDQKKKLEQKGYMVTGVNDLKVEDHTLSGPTRFDFVLSGALHWEPFFRLAIQKYGNDKVIVYTVLLEDAKRLHEEGIHAFYKDDLDHHPLSKRFEQVINEIETLLAIQKISPKVDDEYQSILVGIRERRKVKCKSCENLFDPEANIPSEIASQGLCPYCEQEHLNTLADRLQQDTPAARLFFKQHN